MQADRIRFLDGLRGLAIIGVLVWHYTDEVYASLLPYGTLYAGIPVLDHGWIGVDLFFLISGYVIFLTLERSTGVGDFLRRRWLRLFPAMLIATTIIFAVSQVNGANMVHGRADPIDVLPGLSFISVGFWDWWLPIPVNELDGVFWTLYVEVGFYVVIALLYFPLGWRGALAALTGVWLFTLIGANLVEHFDAASIAPFFQTLQFIGGEYFGWFVSGALFLKAHEQNSNTLFALAILSGLVSAFTSGLWQPDDLVSQFYLAGVVLFFALAQRWHPLQRALAWPPLIFAGFVSYPLYLLHNELGVGLIAALGDVTPPQIWPVLPLVIIAAMFALGALIASAAEPPLKRALGALFPRTAARA